MWHSFLEGFLLGIGACVPLGPINILIMNHALKSYSSGVAVGFGAMSMDIIYLLMILFGVSTFLNNPLTLQILGLLGTFFLAYIAYVIFKGRNNALDTNGVTVSTKSLFKNYLQGLLLTSVNPYTIAFWLSVAGYAVNKEFDIVLTTLGVFGGIVLWTTLMPYVVHQSKHRISQQLSYHINITSALILGFFAVSLLVHLLG